MISLLDLFDFASCLAEEIKSLGFPVQPKFVESLLVLAGMNVADQRIAELVEPGDLMLAADIPLAAKLVERGGQALDPRGELFPEDNIGGRLAARNLLDELRGGGQITGGPANFTAKDRQAFANQLDCWLTAAKKSRSATSRPWEEKSS